MYGESGALMDLLSILEQNKVYFDSLESILAFEENWQTDIENYKEEQNIALLEEIQQQKISLEEYLLDYENKIKDRKQLLLKEKEDIKQKLEKYSIQAVASAVLVKIQKVLIRFIITPRIIKCMRAYNTIFRFILKPRHLKALSWQELPECPLIKKPYSL